jgi:hypothetical protein
MSNTIEVGQEVPNKGLAEVGKLAEAFIATKPVAPETVITADMSPYEKSLIRAARSKSPKRSVRDGDSIASGISLLPIRRPKKDEFVRVLFTREYRHFSGLDMLVVKGPMSTDLYWLDYEGDLLPEVEDSLKRYSLFIAVTNQGEFFLWPLPDEGGMARSSTHDAIELCSEDWYSVRWDVTQFVTASPRIRPDEPKWNKLAPREAIFNASLRHVAITTMEHPVIRRLLGATIDLNEKADEWSSKYK